MLALMGSINSASLLIIIVLPFTREQHLVFFLVLPRDKRETCLSRILHKEFTMWGFVFVHFYKS